MPFWTRKDDAPEAPPVLNCSFCGKSQQEVKKLIAGPEVYICDECVVLCGDIVMGEAVASEAPMPTRAQIDQALAERIVGHARTRAQLAGLLHRHQQGQGPGLRVLVSGPVGSGKSALARALVEATGLPAVCVSAARLTGTGYVGEDVESALDELIHAAGGDLDRARRGVLILDGVQHVVARVLGQDAPRDITGAEVQRALLRVLEGARCRVPDRGNHHPHTQVRELDCRELLVILVATDPSQDAQQVRVSLRKAGLGSELLSRVDVVLTVAGRSAEELAQLGRGALSAELVVSELPEPWLQEQAGLAAASGRGAWALRQAIAQRLLGQLDTAGA